MVNNKHIISGLTWTTIQMLINRSFGFIVKMILARLLFPEDYGLIGMAVVFTTFFRVFIELGFSSTLIQRNDEVLTQQYLSTAFWSNVVWSFFLFACLYFFVAPFATDFYNENSLIYLIPALGLNIIVSPFYLVHRAVLTKQLDFKKIAVANNTASIASGVIAIVLAFLGAGVWALVAQNILLVMIELPLYYRQSKWKPSFTWNKEDFKDMFGFAGYTTLSGLIQRFVSQGDYLIIGKLLGKVELGLYSFAFILTDSIRVQIRMIIEKVMFPVYAKIQDDAAKREMFLNKSIFMNALLISPIIGLLIFSSDLIVVIFGKKWEDSLIIVRIIGMASIFQILSNSYPTIMRANNLSQIELRYKILSVFFIFLPFVFIGTYYYGIIGCSIGVLLSQLFIVVFNLFGMKKYLNIASFALIKSFVKGISATLVSGILVTFVFYFIESKSHTITIIKSITYVLFIIIFTYLLNKNEIFKLLKLIKK
jgi:O-antigen/teichoic acid export membrane protein